MVDVVQVCSLARSRAGPESRGSVVRAGSQDVPERVPAHRPDSPLVSMRDLVGWVDSLSWGVLRFDTIVGRYRAQNVGRSVGLIEKVMEDAPVRASDREHRGVNGMPSQGRRGRLPLLVRASRFRRPRLEAP